MTRTSRFDFGSDQDTDPTFQWETKRKLFSVAEVCAPPSAVLVNNPVFIVFFSPLMGSPVWCCHLNVCMYVCMYVCMARGTGIPG